MSIRRESFTASNETLYAQTLLTSFGIREEWVSDDKVFCAVNAVMDEIIERSTHTSGCAIS